VFDGSGCDTSTDTIVLESLDVPVLGVPEVSAIRCKDANDGKIEVSVRAGASYRWLRDGSVYDTGSLNSAVTTTIMVDKLSPGVYSLEVIPQQVLLVPRFLVLLIRHLL